MRRYIGIANSEVLLIKPNNNVDKMQAKSIFLMSYIGFNAAEAVFYFIQSGGENVFASKVRKCIKMYNFKRRKNSGKG